MATFNKVILIGNLVRDPELRYTPKGTAVCDINLAINRKFNTDDGQKKEEVIFVDVVFFSKSGELVNQHVYKGQPLFVEGRLQMDSWEDKQTGQKRSKLRVVGENFQFLAAPPKAAGETGGGAPAGDRPAESPGRVYSGKTTEVGEDW